MVSDTLTMLKGKGGFIKVSLYVDMYSQHLWVDKLKMAASRKTTCKSLNNICTAFMAPEALMVDRGPEFNNDVVRNTCATRNIKFHIVPAYSPWINGLVEGMNVKLLGRLK
jgi:hypothetical protein